MIDHSQAEHPAVRNARTAVLEQRQAITRRELDELALMEAGFVPGLLALADEVRKQYCGDTAALEVLFNAKKGGCSEDCSFCSQSARYASDVQPERLHSVEDFLAAARAAHDRGAAEFCIVVAVRGPSQTLLKVVIEAVIAIKRETALTVAVSLGLLREEQILALLEAGVDKINHNLETSRRHFPAICTTHSYDERLATCQAIVRHGLNLCCGGIIGMGETMQDRIDFLLELQALGPVEVPVNFLNPRPGTPLAEMSLLDPVEALRFVAMARLALPKALIRFAGGREITLQGLQDLGMRSGANGIILGDYLTTGGRADREDLAMLERLGFVV